MLDTKISSSNKIEKDGKERHMSQVRGGGTELLIVFGKRSSRKVTAWKT